MVLLSSFFCSLLLAVLVLAEANSTWPYWTFESVPYRPPKMEITKSSEPAEPGLIFIGPKNNKVEGMLPNGSTATIYDQDGNLIFHGPDIQTSNLKVQTLFGNPVLTFWSGTRTELGYGYGAVHILDQTYKEIYTVRLTKDFTTPSGIPEDSYIDLHESTITVRNTIIVTSYNLTQTDLSSAGGPADGWALKSQFHEIDIATNDILFSWSPLDHPDKIPLSKSQNYVKKRGLTQERPWDIHHINSIDVADSGYLVSLRFYSSGYYVGNDGSIKWQLDGETGGDFELCSTCNFSWQHDLRIFDETPDSLTMTIFNNAGTPHRDGPYTTGLVVGVDLQNMTVSHQRTLFDLADPIRSGTQGSVQVLGGNTKGNIFMDYGSISTLKEYNAAGETVFTAKFGPDHEIASYRGFKYDWHATPCWNPDVYVTSLSHSITKVFMSWNGATDYNQWTIYGRESIEEFDGRFIATVERTGFETYTTIISSRKVRYLQVIPMQDGKDLGYSTIVEVPEV